MSWRRAVTAAILGASLCALLGVDAGAWAHPRSPAALDSAPAQLVETPASPAAELGRAVVTTAPAPSGLPWVAMAGGLAAVALGRRRPRRVLALAIALVLCVFAFEDGLLATASAHLSATAAEAPAVVDGIAPSSIPARDLDQTVPPPRFLCPVPGRAPPSAIS